jgi:hypothetical protein
MRYAVIVLAANLGAIPALSHRSFAAEYNESQTVTVEGTLTAFLYRNPHTFVEIENTDANGVATKWMAEWYGAGRLSRIGVTADTFKTGREDHDHRRSQPR